MTRSCDVSDAPLPKGWPRRGRSAILHVISLAQYSLSSARGWASDGRNSQARRCAEAGRLEDEVAMLREVHRHLDWYNELRPHMSLGGRKPNEVFFYGPPAYGLPRF